MKKVFLILACMTFSLGGFANSTNQINGVTENSIRKTLFVKQVSDELFKDCTVTIKGTVNRKKIDIKVEYQADNCAAGAIEIIRGVLAEK